MNRAIDTAWAALVLIALCVLLIMQAQTVSTLRDLAAVFPKAASGTSAQPAPVRVLAPSQDPIALAPVPAIQFSAPTVPAQQKVTAVQIAVATPQPTSAHESGAQGSRQQPASRSVVAAPTVPGQRATLPAVPTRLRLLVESQATAEFGLNAPTALFAAQIHQESAWKPEAESKFAQGLTQFTPATAAWIGDLYPAELRPVDPWDPAWAVRAQMRYMRDLVAQFEDGATNCDDWAFGLAGYNGGPGWVRRDQKLAAAAGKDRWRWFDQVELHTNRSAAARKENRSYVRRILLTLEAQYLLAGWPGERTCEQGA